MNSIFNIFNNQPKINIIFILSNIFETINGVSNKYTKFIHFLSSFPYISIKIILTRSKNNNKPFPVYNNVKYYPTKGIRVPFYKDIKVPIISKSSIENLLTDKNNIIIFNGEFIWLYEPLLFIKNKYPQIHLLPNWHTDYEYYLKNVYKIFKFSSSFINHLHFHLQNKDFSGIIVTGQNMVNKYSQFTTNIINVNELDISIFNNFKFDNYLPHHNHFNFIYTGRISKEKNIDLFLSILPLLQYHFEYFHLHFIGDGPYLNEFKHSLFSKFIDLKNKITFHGALQPSQIKDIYFNLNNRIFIFPSTSETFGKSPLEAGACGIPIFLLKSDVSDSIYTHRKNAFIFKNEREFIQELTFFQNLDKELKQEFIHNTIDNALQYDQNKIFNNWLNFILQLNHNQQLKLNLFDHISFKSFNELVQCSNNFFGEN